MIGCADAVRGYPTIERPEITTSRIGVVDTNAGALVLWRTLGYHETAEPRAARPPFVANTIVLERIIGTGA